MAEIAKDDDTEGGRWLSVTHEGGAILGAHLQAGATPNTPFTIMWLGTSSAGDLVQFCGAVSSKFVDELKSPTLHGRVFASGRSLTFDGARWLEAATLPQAQLLRFECAPESVVSPQSKRDGVVVWARMDVGSSSLQKEEDENVGVSLAPSRLFGLADPLATFIAGTMVRRPSLGVVRDALRIVVEHITPRSTPAAA